MTLERKLSYICFYKLAKQILVKKLPTLDYVLYICPIKTIKRMANKRITIEMDTCLGFSEHEAINTITFFKFLEANDIAPNIITWNGPAGGNPLVHYTGTDEALRKMLIEQFECDDEDVEFYMAHGPEGAIIS